MLALIIRRSVRFISHPIPIVRHLALATKPSSRILARTFTIKSINHNLPNMQQMMDEMSKNPKAIALFRAIQKDPKILRAMQDLMMVMVRKGYIDMRNPMKQPSTFIILDLFSIKFVISLSLLAIAMLADSEIRSKLLELMKLLSAAGIFDAKDSINPGESLSKIMGFLLPSSKQSKDAASNLEIKSKVTPTYDLSYDATTKETHVKPQDDPFKKAWAEKFKKIFK